MSKIKIHIGTSGWSYEEWKKVFYPQEIKNKEQLEYYSQHFDTVEINSTFYHLPLEKTIQNWSEKVSKNFIFSVKASRYITHIKRLREGEITTPRLFEKISLLGHQLGPILFQLPNHFKKDKDRLEEFFINLTRDFHYTFEFRDPSWFTDEIYDLLKKYHIALCITDLKGHLSPEELTSHFTYIRLHGPKFAYQGSYSKKQLEDWKRKILNWVDHKISVYCYFDNTDSEAHAIKNAKELKRLVDQP